MGATHASHGRAREGRPGSTVSRQRLRNGEENMTGFVLRALISAIGLWIATYWVSGIRIDDATTLILAGALLGIINAIVRPIAILLTLPITILSLGFFLLVVNAGMVALVAAILPGFHIPGGFWSAFGTALIVWITGWVGSWLIGSRGKIDVYVRKL
jgi:putative membrane protein